MDECRKCGYSKAEQARGSFLVCADCGEPWPTEQMPEHQRAITAHEGQEIAEFLGAHWGMDSKEEIDDIRESMRGAAVRKYMSDGPGYFGDIFFVVFGGGPEFHFVLTNYKDEGFRIVEREFPPANDLHDPGCNGDPARCDCQSGPNQIIYRLLEWAVSAERYDQRNPYGIEVIREACAYIALQRGKSDLYGWNE